MKIKFLGTGTSTGVPEIGCTCSVCRSSDKRDKRLRTSVLVNIGDKQILIDCGPDFREQILSVPFLKLDAVLLTHEHYDHVGGIDDLRPFCKFGDIDIYSNKIVNDALKKRMSYCFVDNTYPGVPVLKLHEIGYDAPFDLNGTAIQPVKVMHLNLPISGYRINNFAYLTDVKSIPEEEFEKLKDLDLLIMNALRREENISHQNLEEALMNVRRINPKQTYFIHMSHHIGLHEETQKLLPSNVYFAYDGLELEI